MRVPDTYIVGTHKGGTTSLFQTLCALDGVFEPAVKEPHHHVAALVDGTIPVCVGDPLEYRSLYAQALPNDRVIDASVLNLPLHQAAIPGILRDSGPDAQIVIVLREPIARAFSAYTDVAAKNGLEDLKFGEALLAEKQRARSTDFPVTMLYSQLSIYAQSVRAYLEEFNNVHVTSIERLLSSDDRDRDRLAADLGLAHVPDLLHENGSVGTWRSARLRRVANAPAATELRRGMKERFPGTHRRAVGFTARTLLGPRPPSPEPLPDAVLEAFSRDAAELAELLGVVPWQQGPLPIAIDD
jgi:hypothetical protein